MTGNTVLTKRKYFTMHPARPVVSTYIKNNVPFVWTADTPAKGLATFQDKREIQVLTRDRQTMEGHPPQSSDSALVEA